ncbi:MAG TPA: heavy-metal-associated domain-containing protein [Bacteroidales bacterium]|nr:heavy-metal-associated domain-containing protein [Bacteroidales bacterium]
MKTKILNLVVGLFLITSFSVSAQEAKTEKFNVYGNCGMCENRIEKAALALDGVSKADWNKENEMLEITFDESKVKVDDVHQAVAKVGHDTDKVKADDEVYQALPKCCLYR